MIIVAGTYRAEPCALGVQRPLRSEKISGDTGICNKPASTFNKLRRI
jgi:hypothetical protein